MNTVTAAAAAAVIAVVACGPAHGQSNFKVMGPSQGAPRHLFSDKDPTDFPPFCHWDLRVWNSCTVPFKVTSQPPGVVVGDDAIDANGDVTSGPNGICETAAAPGDQQVIPVGNGQPGEVCIGPGPDGVSQSWGVGDDGFSGGIDTGANGVCESIPDGDDPVVIPRGQGKPNSVCVQGGNTAPNTGTVEPAAIVQGVMAWNAVNPALHQWSFAGTSAAGEQSDGVNYLGFEYPANQHPELSGLYGLTYVTCHRLSGIITDADVLFNRNVTWSVSKSGGVCQGANQGYGCRSNADCGAGSFCTDIAEDLVATATHEAGHMLGLHHSQKSGAIMQPVAQLGLGGRTLTLDDEDGKNWIYTPDLGDAPDPSFPSYVHGSPQPDDGAEHLFGWTRAGANYRYEWLGAVEDGSAGECEALTVDQDASDDGVEFGPRIALRGKKLKIRVTVSSSAPAGRYTSPFDLYLNGWLDLDGSGVWENAERLIQDTYNGADTRIYEVTIPQNAPDEFWTRLRLDWAENVTMPGIDPTLDRERGAAQFGEVEDYPIQVRDLRLLPGEPSSPRRPLALPMLTLLDQATGDLTVLYDGGCDAIDHTIYWGSLNDPGDFSSWTGQACFLGAEGTATFNPGPGSYFFVIVANDGLVEGSYGTDSDGFERAPAGPPALDACAYPQELGALCDYAEVPE